MENSIIYDIDCEKAVIGTLLSDRNAFDKVHEYLNENCFYNSLNRNVYLSIASLVGRGERADIVTIIPELAKMGVKAEPYEIAEYLDCHTFDLEQYSMRLNELAKRRSIYALGLSLVTNGSEEVKDIADVISDATSEINGLLCDSQTTIKTSDDYLSEVWQKVQDNINGKKSDSTLIGFTDFDSRGGFKPGNLIIIAADSSQGKTSLADTIALNVVKSGTPIAFYSLEMTAVQLMTRLAAIESGVPAFVISDKAMTERQLLKFNEAVGRLSHLPMYFDDRSSSSIDTIVSSIRTLYLKHHIKGCFVDYLQILSVNSKNTNTEYLLAECARRLKNLAKELNIFVVLLSQLSRDLQSPEPTLARLRGSGQVNEAADMTILIYRPEYYSKTYGKVLHYPGSFKNVSTNGTALINVAKNRNGETFQFVAGFDAATTHFFDLDEKPLLAEQVEEEPF
jgi:replicative DNA helicase